MIFYFTGTGNSLYAAKQLEDDLTSIPQAMRGAAELAGMNISTCKKSLRRTAKTAKERCLL